MSGLPLLPPRVSASLRPSGDHSGAPLTPARADTWRRSPLRTSCTYTPECLVSNETYASHCPSGDHDVVAARALPEGRRDLIGARRRGRHALTRQRPKAPAAFQVVLHDLGHIQAAVGRYGTRERHDRDRYRIAYPGGDLDLQRGLGAARRAQGDDDYRECPGHGTRPQHELP